MGGGGCGRGLGSGPGGTGCGDMHLPDARLTQNRPPAAELSCGTLSPVLLNRARRPAGALFLT